MKETRLIMFLLVIMTAIFCGCEGDNEPPAPIPQNNQFTLLQTTDMHNRISGLGVHADYSPLSINDDDVLGGFARIGEKIRLIRKEQEEKNIPVIVVDSGDFLMGTVYDLAATDPPAMRFLQMAQYDAVTLGNHEFDYSPVGLASILNAAIASGFTVPIIETNMVTDGATGTTDDGIETLVSNGAIQKTLLLTLENGLKVGIIGLMGQTAEFVAPLAVPVTFDHKVADIQAQVDDLKNNQGAQIVIALSHSGVTDPNGTPKGDDISLAENVTGIDIIASGHEHETTQTVINENGTFIICAGSYGTNLARLDVTYNPTAQKIDTPTLTNITIDDSFMGSVWMQTVVFDEVDNTLDQNLKALDPNLSIAGTIGVCATDNLGKPHGAVETGIGNLAADSVRYTLQGAVALGLIQTPTVGLVAQGVVRSGFEYGQNVSFADAFAVLPLGITPATDQAMTMPGYPLMQVYLTGSEIQNVCQFIAYVIASQDTTFMTALAGGAAQQQLLYGALSRLSTDYYMNLSGVKYTHAGIAGAYTVTDVQMYANDDYQCSKATSTVVSDQYYPCVVDIYALSLLQSSSMQTLLTALNIPIQPKYNANPTNPANPDFQVITAAQLLSTRLDSEPDALGGTSGIQEVKEWMALLNYLTAPSTSGGLGSIISDEQYGQGALGRIVSP